jgi:hypothetical protein
MQVKERLHVPAQDPPTYSKKQKPLADAPSGHRA